MSARFNTASGAMLGNPGQTNYTAAKAGIAAATLVMAQELSRYGVRAKLSRARSANAAHAADTRPRGSRRKNWFLSQDGLLLSQPTSGGVQLTRDDFGTPLAAERQYVVQTQSRRMPMNEPVFLNFESAARAVLSFLHRRVGFNLWMVTRTEGEDWIVLQAEDHGYGVTTRYGHTSQVFVEVGQKVKQGMTIAAVGLSWSPALVVLTWNSPPERHQPSHNAARRCLCHCYPSSSWFSRR